MRIMFIVCGVALAAVSKGCGGSEMASRTPLTEKDIVVSLALAQQDIDGFPHAFQVTFENESAREGVVALPRPLPGRVKTVPLLAPSVVLLVSTQDGRTLNFTYAAIGATRPKPVESVRLRPGERGVREYATSDFYAWGRSGPDREKSFAKCFGPGATAVQVRAAFVVRTADDRPEEPVNVESEGVRMLCSFDESVFRKKGRELEPPTTPLHEAVWTGDVEAVQRLIAEGANVNAELRYRGTPLILAAEKGDARIAEILLAAGASFEARDADGNTPLHVAASEGNVEVMKLLIARGAGVDMRATVSRWTSLHSAALEGELEAAKVLLAAGADPNAKDSIGDTPLCLAAMKGHEEVVVLLLDKGADLRVPGNGGMTALHRAAGNGYTKLIGLLLARGANPNAKDRSGQTPLAAAAMGGRERTAEILLAHGADPNVTDNKGRTPLALATEKGYKGLVKLLEEHGAKE